MENSTNIFKILFVVLIFYILWAISLNFGGIERLGEVIIWFLSFIFIYLPVFLISALVHEFKKPKEDTNSKLDEKFEDYADRRIDEIERALMEYRKEQCDNKSFDRDGIT